MKTLFGDEPRYEGGLREVGEGVHAWLAPNGNWGESNAGLVVGDGASLLVDTQWDLALTRNLLHALEPLVAGAPITQVVNTHGDPDHCFGNQLVPGAQILATLAATEQIRDSSPSELDRFRALARGLSLAGRSPLPWPGRGTARRLGRYAGRMLAPFDFDGIEITPPTRTFEGSLELDVGGRRAELIEVGPAHSPGDALVHVPGAGVVFSGDIVFIESTPVMWAGPVGNWIAALDRLLGLDADTVVPGHGPVTDKQGVRRVRDYWSWLSAAVSERFAREVPAAEAAAELLRSADFRAQEFASWDCPERIAINVRTLYLELEGKPTEPGTRELLSVFRRVADLAAERPDAGPAVLHRDL